MTTPKHFVNLHAHSTFSVGDGIGMPQDHIDYAVKNGADALALTDHGNMNGFSYQYLHSKKLKDKGVPFKALSGVEAYFIPSLSDWRKLGGWLVAMVVGNLGACSNSQQCAGYIAIFRHGT